MADPNWSPEVRRWIEVGLEADYSVYEDHEGRGFTVEDGECDVVARCPDRERAEIVRDALALYDRDMFRQQILQVEAAERQSEEKKEGNG